MPLQFAHVGDLVIDHNFLLVTQALATNDTPSATLPTGLVDNGTETLFQTQAMAAAGVGPWKLRYRATNPDGSANANTHKWDFIGGNPWRNAIATDQSVPANFPTWNDPATVGPIVTLPLAGVYLAQAGCDGFSNGVAQAIVVGIAVGATVPTGGNLRDSFVAAASQREQISVEAELTVTAGQDIRMRYTGNGGGGQFATFGRRFLIVTPLRVG